MPWDWGQIFDYAAPIVGGLLEREGSKDAARAESAGYRDAIAEQRRQFDTIMGLQAPYQQVGTQALNELGRVFGYAPTTAPVPSSAPGATTTPMGGGGGTQAGLTAIAGQGIGALAGAAGLGPLAPFAVLPALLSGSSRARNEATLNGIVQALIDRRGLRPQEADLTQNPIGSPAMTAQPMGLDAFTASPDYQFRRNEGIRGIENSFAARGGALSGNALRSLNEFNSNLASGEFGDFFNRRAALAGIGQTATNNASSTAFNTGANIGNLLGAQGQSRASGITGGTNALTGTLQNLLSTWNRRNGLAA